MKRGLLLVALLAALPAATSAEPIPSGPAANLPQFQGHVAKPRRLSAEEPPRHPFMAPNARSNLHDDGFQSDSYWRAGPLGRNMSVTSTFQVADCASVTFDSRGRIVTVCVGLQGPRLVMMDPHSLAELATMTLPPRMGGGAGLLTDFAGGGYFYLDNHDRAVIPTTTRHVYVVKVNASPGFTLERDYDLTGAVPSGDKIISALPDWSGRLWFATTGGRVGTIDRSTGAVHATGLDAEIENSFAVDDTGGVYVVTMKSLYRLDARGGRPAVTWRRVYRNSGIAKPGQVDAGSGTTPTVMSGGRVAITDNADPMDVVVYRTGAGQKICEQPVFGKGASATDNSLIAARNSLVVENNYGYKVTTTEEGGSTTPGLERVDLLKHGGCRRVWRSGEIAPSVVSKLSTETGLVYTYTKPPRDDREDAWYFTALDFCTGRTVYKRLTGEGLGYNNHYAPVTLGPDGTAYVGAISGLIALRDSRRPSGPPSSDPLGCRPKPRLALRIRARRKLDRRGRLCAPGRVRVRVRGLDSRGIRRVRFAVGRRQFRDRKAPFSRIVDRGRRGHGSRLHRVRARVRMKDGRSTRLTRRYRVCASR
ncbi:MAG TPA: hypothetical protein VGF21_09590 [Thermoleophilaceae bacterium]